MSDTGYAWWRDALAGTIGPIHDSTPQLGFYRRRLFRGGPFAPVAIWEHEGQMVAVQDDRPVDANEIWTYCATHPVTEEAFRARMATGKWHDEDEAVAETLSPPAAGHNAPPTDEAEILQGQIDAAAASAEKYADIRDDETASKAQSLRSRLNELSGLADKRRDALKRPHLEAGRAIDAKFQPLVKAAKAAADAIARALSQHETRKARAAEEARQKAEAARRAAEEANRKAAEAGKPPPPPILSPPPIAAPEPVTTIRGAYGRAASVKVVKIVTVVDFDAAYQSVKANMEMKQLIIRLAQKAVDAGYEVAGCTIEEQRKVS